MLGFALCREAQRLGLNFLAIGRTNRHNLPAINFVARDLTKQIDLAEIVATYKPDMLIHAAALTDHSLCGKYPDVARALHVDVSRALAHAQSITHKKFIHISTESVYGGGTASSEETSPCNPVGVYAETKLAGEVAVLDANPDALVLRVTPVGISPGLHGRSLVEWLLRSFLKGQAVNGYVDAVFTPVTSFQLADFAFSPAANTARGIFNIGCTVPMTKYDMAHGLCSRLKFDPSLVCATHAPPTMAICGALNNSKIGTMTDWKAPSPLEVLDDLAHQIRDLHII